MQDSHEETYGLDPATPAPRKPAPPTQPRPYRSEAVGDTMLEDAIRRKRASKQVQQADDVSAKSMYLVPAGIFLVGIAIVCAILAVDEPALALGYLLTYAVSLPVGMGAYCLFCLLWIGFDAPLHVIALRLAASFAVMDVATVIFGPVPLISIIVPLLIFTAMLKFLLEVEWFEAMVIGLVSWFIRFVIFAVIASAIG